ncbi:serine recombinase [Rhodococcus qingshengii]|nr:serine recombinase [Rhodococcus qingshengii]
MRTAIYTRISLDRTGEGLGVERHFEDCSALAKTLNWEVVEHYSDNDISASRGLVRPRYEDMLADIQAGKIDAVIVYHADRLYRSPLELERLIAIFANTEIRTVKSGTLDLTTYSGRMVARILGSVARAEVDAMSDRRKRANDQKAASGLWIASRRPFGYTIDGELLEPEATAIREAVQSVLSGMSVRQVAREWNAAGLRTAHGGQEWKSTSVRRVLKNPRYAALRVHRGAVVGSGQWPAIIDVDAHYGIVAFLDDPKRSSSLGFERKWQGSGVYRCGVCDERMVVHVDANKRRSYKCPQNHVRRQGVALDELVDGVVIARLSMPDAAVVLQSDEIDVAGLQVERDSLQVRAEQIAGMFGSGAMDAGQFEAANAALQLQVDRVDAELGKARMGDPLVELVLAGGRLVEVWEGKSPDLRGKIIDALMVVRVHPSDKGLRRFDPRFIEIERKV